MEDEKRYKHVIELNVNTPNTNQKFVQEAIEHGQMQGFWFDSTRKDGLQAAFADWLQNRQSAQSFRIASEHD